MTSAPILAGIDQSPRGADALALARALQAALDAPLVVANVRPAISEPWWQGSDELDETYRRASESVLDLARDTLRGDATTTFASVADNSVPRALQELSEKEHAALIVVARTHHGRVRRVAGVAERLLHGTSAAVAIAPPGLAERGSVTIQRVAVAFDGSPEGSAALADAAAIAARTGASLRVIGVSDVMALAWAGPPAGAAGAALADQLRAGLRDRIDAAIAEREDLEPEVTIVDGAPSTALAQASNDADLLVCGSRGIGPIAAALTGSVSNQLAHSAECPVLVIPRGSGRLLEDPAATTQATGS